MNIRNPWSFQSSVRRIYNLWMEKQCAYFKFILLWKWPCQLPRPSVPIQRGCLYCKRPSYCGAARPLNRLRTKHLRVWRRQTTSKRRDPSLVSRGQSNLRACCLLMFQIDKRLVHKLVWPHAKLAPRVFYT